MSDLKAGLITAVVALPLAIAFTIASGVEPVMGLYTAIIAGMLISTFGGSRYSVSGPTGAMTVFENKVDEHIHMSKPHMIIRMYYVPFIDTTGIERLKSFIITRKGTGAKVYLTTVQPEVMRSINSDAVLNKLMQDKDATVFKSTQEALGHLQEMEGNR